MDPKELVERQTGAWNARNREEFFALYVDDCEVTAPGFSGKGRQGLQDFWSLWMGAFPDNKVTVRVLVAEGDNVAEESYFEGTNSGPLPSPDGTEIPPTGRQATEPFTAFHTISGDKAVSSRFYFDQVELLSQLGLMPS